MMADKMDDNLAVKGFAERNDGILTTYISDTDSQTQPEVEDVAIKYVPYDVVVE